MPTGPAEVEWLTREQKDAISSRLAQENAAYDGGKSGLEAFYKFSRQVSSHLFLGGKVAVIATSLNHGIEKTVEELQQRIGPTEILAKESFFFEKIALIEATLK